VQAEVNECFQFSRGRETGKAHSLQLARRPVEPSAMELSAPRLAFSAPLNFDNQFNLQGSITTSQQEKLCRNR